MPVLLLPGPPTQRKKNFLNDGKGTEMDLCAHRAEAFMHFYPDQIRENLSGRRHALANSCKRHLHVVGQRQVYNFWASQSERICLHALRCFRTLHPVSWACFRRSQHHLRHQDLGKAWKTPLFIECSQCIGLQPNAELDYCT